MKRPSTTNYKKMPHEKLLEREKDLDKEIKSEIEKNNATEGFINTLKMAEFENNPSHF